MKSADRPLTPAEWEQLSAYVDGALPPEVQRAVEARLASDPAWQAAWAELRALKRALRQLPAPARPRSFVLSQSQLENAPAPYRRWAWAWGGLATAAVVGLLAWLVVGAGLGRLGSGLFRTAAPPLAARVTVLPGAEKVGPPMLGAAPAARPPQAEALEAADLPEGSQPAASLSPTPQPMVGPTPSEARGARPVAAEPFPQHLLLWAAVVAGGLALLGWLLRRR